MKSFGGAPADWRDARRDSRSDVAPVAGGNGIFAARDKTHGKRPRDTVRLQRPKGRLKKSREMAAKAGFPLAGFEVLVSEDWVVVCAVRYERVSTGHPSYSLLFVFFQGQGSLPFAGDGCTLRVFPRNLR